MQKLVVESMEKDLARRIRGYDFIACKAQYHRSCGMNYNDPAKWRSKDKEGKQIVIDQTMAHDSSCNGLIDLIFKLW